MISGDVTSGSTPWQHHPEYDLNRPDILLVTCIFTTLRIKHVVFSVNRSNIAPLLNQNGYITQRILGIKCFQVLLVMIGKLLVFLFLDAWYITDKNVACQYHEKSNHLCTLHNITFNQESLLFGAPNPDIFYVPSYKIIKRRYQI